VCRRNCKVSNNPHWKHHVALETWNVTVTKVNIHTWSMYVITVSLFNFYILLQCYHRWSYPPELFAALSYSFSTCSNVAFPLGTRPFLDWDKPSNVECRRPVLTKGERCCSIGSGLGAAVEW
jgi:hypothetical protein